MPNKKRIESFKILTWRKNIGRLFSKADFRPTQESVGSQDCREWLWLSVTTDPGRQGSTGRKCQELIRGIVLIDVALEPASGELQEVLWPELTGPLVASSGHIWLAWQPSPEPGEGTPNHVILQGEEGPMPLLRLNKNQLLNNDSPGTFLNNIPSNPQTPL
jgi:hypothetical protein